MKAQRGRRHIALLFLTSMLEGMGSQQHAHLLHPLREECQYPMQSWVGPSTLLERCGENPTRVQTLGHPAHSKSLDCLHYGRISIIPLYIKLYKNTYLHTQAYSWWIQDGYNSFSCNFLCQGWKNIFNTASNEFTVCNFIFCSINFCIFHILLQIFHSKHLSTFLGKQKKNVLTLTSYFCNRHIHG